MATTETLGRGVLGIVVVAVMIGMVAMLGFIASRLGCLDATRPDGECDG